MHRGSRRSEPGAHDVGTRKHKFNCAFISPQLGHHLRILVQKPQGWKPGPISLGEEERYPIQHCNLQMMLAETFPASSIVSSHHSVAQETVCGCSPFCYDQRFFLGHDGIQNTRFIEVGVATANFTCQHTSPVRPARSTLKHTTQTFPAVILFPLRIPLATEDLTWFKFEMFSSLLNFLNICSDDPQV